MPFGLVDISALTNELVKALQKAMDASPLFPAGAKPVVSASAPDIVRAEDGCQVTLYLFHVAPDAQYRNTPVTGRRPQEIPVQPMALILHYQLSAFHKKEHFREQQAMSVALKTLYEKPSFEFGSIRFTVTLQPDSPDQWGQLWQSFAVAGRLSVVYRVAVVFLVAPDPKAEAKEPTVWNIVADPAELPFGKDGSVLGTERRVTYRVPSTPPERSYLQSPASASAGQALHLWGSKLGEALSTELYLLSADGTIETKVTSWKVAPDKDARLTVRLPATVGTAPADTPAAGVYQLRAGNDGPKPYRTNATPFSIAPAIDGPAPAASVLLADVGGTFTITGKGFTAATTEVSLETVPLRGRSAGPVGDGEFLVDPGLTSIQFRAPVNLPPGDYAVRVRTNQIESDPAWWIRR